MSPSSSTYRHQGRGSEKSFNSFALPLLPQKLWQEEERGSSVVAKILTHIRSLHVSRCTRRRWTWDTSWLILNHKERASGLFLTSHPTPRRKPWALPRAHIRPQGEDLGPFFPDIRNCQTSLRHWLSAEIPASIEFRSAGGFSKSRR